MFARTFLAASFIFISLICFGCASESAPAVKPSPAPAQPVFTQRSGQDDAALVAQRGGPRPSVVRWVGPPPDSRDVDLVQSVQTPPVAANDRPIQKPDNPTVTPATQPVLTEAASRPVQVTRDSGNPPVVQAPLVAVNPATHPTDVAIKKEPDTEVKIANSGTETAIVPDDAHPPAVAIVSPATKPAAPDVVINMPKDSAGAADLLPSRPLTGVTFESVLEQLPPDAEPLPKFGWDAFAIGKALKWINQQLDGGEMQVTVEIAGVELIRIPDAKDPVETIGWEVALTTEPESFRCFGIDTFHWPATWTEDASGKRWRGGEVRVPVTEEFAKQARLWRVGDTVVLSGGVETVSIEGGTTNLGQPCGKFTTIFSDIHIDKHISQSTRP